MKRRSASGPAPQRSQRSPRGDASYSKSGRSPATGLIVGEAALLVADGLEEGRHVAELEPAAAVAARDLIASVPALREVVLPPVPPPRVRYLHEVEVARRVQVGRVG